MDWKLNRVSIEPEEVFAEINQDLRLPVGIVLFGADSELKAKVYQQFCQKITKLTPIYRYNLDRFIFSKVEPALSKGQSVLVCMTGEDSLHLSLRQQNVRQLSTLGTRMVIGVYVKASRKDRIDLNAIGSSQNFGHPEYYHQIYEMEHNPPLPNEFSRYIVITDG